jgi:hypothetical protein
MMSQKKEAALLFFAGLRGALGFVVGVGTAMFVLRFDISRIGALLAGAAGAGIPAIIFAASDLLRRKNRAAEIALEFFRDMREALVHARVHWSATAALCRARGILDAASGLSDCCAAAEYLIHAIDTQRQIEGTKDESEVDTDGKA